MILVVDLGGVAAGFHPERRLAALAEASGLAPETIRERLFSSGLDDDAEVGRYTPDELIRSTRAALSDTVDPDQLIDAWSTAFEPDPRVLRLLAGRLEAKALFTNNGPLIDLCLRGPLHAISDSFEHVICSWHIAAKKPEPEAFSRAAAVLRSRPDELVLLDDSEPNVTAARSAGWSGSLVASAADVRDALEHVSLHS